MPHISENKILNTKYYILVMSERKASKASNESNDKHGPVELEVKVPVNSVKHLLKSMIPKNLESFLGCGKRNPSAAATIEAVTNGNVTKQQAFEEHVISGVQKPIQQLARETAISLREIANTGNPASMMVLLAPDLTETLDENDETCQAIKLTGMLLVAAEMLERISKNTEVICQLTRMELALNYDISEVE